MQTERWQSCTAIFHEALELAPEERRAFLERRCDGDAALRKQVEVLLRSHEEAADFIEAPIAASAPELLRGDPDSLIGQQLGSYRITSVLGAGGMGVVYLAHDERLGRKVGLKLLPPSLIADETQLHRLQHEARTASALNHPNIVTVHEIGQVDSTHYIAIEFIEGVTLRERINRGPVPPDEALEIVKQVASALCVAHRAGIVHRDIKPENIMVRPDGYVKVLDFGIARSGASDPAMRAGAAMGTLRYMSPEQARGEAVDARSDIWSLGAVLYEMLTRKPIIGGETPAEVKAAVLDQPLPVLDSTTPATLQQIVRKCLRRDPAARYASTEELLKELRRAAAPAPRRRWPAVAAGAALIGLIAVMSMLFRAPQSGEPATSSRSIAVLPFADLSPEQDQRYFSDGMTEEIRTALAQVKELRVSGRSSSFALREKNSDVRSIGAALGVAHVVEGSVRKHGERVRITAQLTQVADGFNLWSETYDGDLRDVFNLQERIARAITNELQIVLQDEQSRLVKTATDNPDAYALFLQATAIFNRRDSTRFADAAAQLQEAIRLDPQFARARARLASLASVAPGYDVELAPNLGELAEREARLAIRTDEKLAEPYAALGQLLFTQRRFRDAHAAYQQALKIDPEDSTANLWLSTLLISTGHAKAGAAVLDKLLASDPMLPNALLWRGWAHLQLGEIEAAERLIQRAADAGLTAVGLGFAHIAHARGDSAARAEWMARGLEPFLRDLPEETCELIGAGIVDAAKRQRAIAVLEEYLQTEPAAIAGGVPFALLWLGQPGRALAAAEGKPTRNDTLLLASLWTAAGREARALPEFPQFARQSGLAEFWDTSGPPAPCWTTAPGLYVCE